MKAGETSSLETVPSSSAGPASPTDQNAGVKVVPKLRLTLRLPNQPAATEASNMGKEETTKSKAPSKGQNKSAAQTGTGTAFKGINKKPTVSGNGKGLSTTAATAKILLLQDSSQSQPASKANEAPIELAKFGPVERKELPPQFAEQVQILKELKAFKTRKWTTHVATIKTVSGAIFAAPMWAREGDFSNNFVKEGATSRRASVDDFAANGVVVDAAGSLPTFVCPVETCHKIFDTKEKWKRHQGVHRKKLQLKLPNLNRIQQQQQQQTTAQSLPPSEIMEMEEVPESSKIDSEI